MSKRWIDLKHKASDGDNDGIIFEYLDRVGNFYVEAYEGANSALSTLSREQVIRLRDFLIGLELER